MKFCINCVHHVPDTTRHTQDGKYDKCTAPQSFTDLNLVTGQKEQKYHGFCEALRNSDTFCGPVANWFSPKDLLADLEPEKKLEVLDILTAEKEGNF